MRIILLKIFILCSFISTSYAADVDDAEFGGLCVMGLAEGKVIKTDCDITWQDNNQKTYCF